jgi:hypothetical protein
MYHIIIYYFTIYKSKINNFSYQSHHKKINTNIKKNIIIINYIKSTCFNLFIIKITTSI